LTTGSASGAEEFKEGAAAEQVEIFGEDVMGVAEPIAGYSLPWPGAIKTVERFLREGAATLGVLTAADSGFVRDDQGGERE
jgi:hypothetical protein